MKKLIFICLIAFSLCLEVFANEQTVYVSGFGNDLNCGSIDEPLKTLEAGFHALPCGGKIVLTTAVSYSEILEFPEVDGLVTITSDDGITDYRELYGAKLYFGGNVKFRGDVKFENVDFVSCVENCSIICNGNYVCFGEGIRTFTVNDDIGLISIIGGGAGRHPASGSFVEVHSGDWNYIKGGRYNDTQDFYGDVNVAIYGGTVHGQLWLSGSAFTYGNANLYIFGGTFKESVQIANKKGFSGDVSVSIFGGEFEKAINVSDGGRIDKNLEINVFANVKAQIVQNSGTVGKNVRINTSNAVFVSSNFDIYLIKDAFSAREEILKRFAFDKKAALETKWTTALHERDMAFVKTLSTTEKLTPGGDLDKSGFISLNDALLALSGKDVDGDGRTTVKDGATLINATLAGEVSVAKVQKGSEEIKLYGAVQNGELLSKGYAFANAKSEKYKAYTDVLLDEKGTAGIFFGCDGDNPKTLNGYYFEASLERGTLAAYRVMGGIYKTLGSKTLDLLSKNARISVEYANNAATLYFDDNPLQLFEFFDFNFVLEPYGTYVGMYVENATATLIRYEGFEISGGATYKNELISDFTDPDIFCEDGVYYIYGTRGSNGVDCFSTTDFVNFVYEGKVLKKGDAFGDSGGFLAANIIKYDGYYYMFYLVGSDALGHTTTSYAVSTSPKGPFTNPIKEPLCDLPDIIGGQPFLDDDGTVYLIYTRTTGGNQTYGARVILKDGKATLDLASERFLLGVSEEWEAARASVVECGFIVKHEGLYYLIYAGGNYNSTYGVGYAISENPLGPYKKYDCNPVLIGTTQSYAVGAASVFPSADGREYFIIHLRSFSYSATRPLQTCMDRFRFVDDPRGGADLVEICGPSASEQKIPSALYTMSSDEWQSIRFHP